MESDFLSKKEVAALIKVTVRTVERLVRRGTLISYRRGRRVYFSRDQVSRLLE